MSLKTITAWAGAISTVAISPIIALYDAVRRSLKAPQSLHDRNIIITGAGSGIGKNLANLCALENCNLILVDINEEALKEVEQELLQQTVSTAAATTTKIKIYTCDLAKKEEIKTVFDKILKDFKTIDILINCAGIILGKPFDELDDDEFIKVMDINFNAYVRTTRMCLNHMSEKGQLIYISSLAGLTGFPRMVDYCASKCAVTGFCDALRLELRNRKPHPITVTCIYPSFINTGMFNGASLIFMRMLDQNDVAKQILDAIKYGDEQVIMPSYGVLICLIRCLPDTAIRWLESIADWDNMMIDFKGHHI